MELSSGSSALFTPWLFTRAGVSSALAVHSKQVIEEFACRMEYELQGELFVWQYLATLCTQVAQNQGYTSRATWVDPATSWLLS